MIGLFDSGIGGLSIFREVHRLLPGYSTIYIGDQTHVPYGPRPQAEIRKFTTAAMRFLVEHQANPNIIACNTASGAALQHVRNEFPETQFVGLVPAVKPAAESTKTGRIGVLATPGTFRGKLYLRVKNQFAANVIVYQDTVPGLAVEIERGEEGLPEVRRILEKALLPMIAKDIDKVVLGCTHYPFAEEIIQSIVGPDIEIIEPGEAIARRVQSLLGEKTPEQNPTHLFFSTGDIQVLQTGLARLLNWEQEVLPLRWTDKGTLTYA